jgi:hypothetical protein
VVSGEILRTIVIVVLRGITVYTISHFRGWTVNTIWWFGRLERAWIIRHIPRVAIDTVSRV